MCKKLFFLTKSKKSRPVIRYCYRAACIVVSDRAFPQRLSFLFTNSSMNWHVPSVPSTEESMHRW